MIYDALVQFIADRWVPGSGPVLSVADWMFLGHHAATSFYMTSARVVKAGHMSAMALMFFGEVSRSLSSSSSSSIFDLLTALLGFCVDDGSNHERASHLQHSHILGYLVMDPARKTCHSVRLCVHVRVHSNNDRPNLCSSFNVRHALHQGGPGEHSDCPFFFLVVNVSATSSPWLHFGDL